MTERVPATLLEAVRADHGAVQPLPSPWRRTLALAPVGALLALSAPLFWGWRGDFDSLGPVVAWGLSSLQALVSLWIVGAALREAVPGRALSRGFLIALVGAALAVEVGVTLVTAAKVPMVVPPWIWRRWAWECLGMATTTGAPVLAACGWLASRGLPERPALAGAICGLGGGLLADSGARLFCWVTEPAHVLVSHGGAILVFAGAGALAATLVDRLRD